MSTTDDDPSTSGYAGQTEYYDLTTDVVDDRPRGKLRRLMDEHFWQAPCVPRAVMYVLGTTTFLWLGLYGFTGRKRLTTGASMLAGYLAGLAYFVPCHARYEDAETKRRQIEDIMHQLDADVQAKKK